jgi:hypothetical protein
MALHEVQLKGYSVRPGNLSLGTFDSYGIEQLHVTADDSWDGLDILAVFHAPDGTATKVVVGADGMLAVPPEATAKQAGVGRIVFVGLAENVQRITVDIGYNIKPHSDIEGDNPGTPTPDVVQQILANSNNAVSIATAAQDAAENARQAAEDAAKKAGEGAGGAAASAAAAKKSAEDAAASSESAAGKAEAAESSANAANESAKAAQTAQGSAENAAQTAANAAGVAGQAAGEAAQSANAAETAKQSAEDAAKKALEAKTGSENALQDADAAKDAASGYADAAAKSATAAAASEKKAAKSENSAADSAAAAKKSAADADNTVNSIKDSMAQISENKEAVSQLKEDLGNIISPNLFNPAAAKANVAISSGDGSEMNGFSGWEATDYIPVSKGDVLYFSANNEPTYYSTGAFYDAQKKFISGFGNPNNNNNIAVTSDGYARFSFDSKKEKLQIENGLRTTYVPYGEVKVKAEVSKVKAEVSKVKAEVSEVKAEVVKIQEDHSNLFNKNAVVKGAVLSDSGYFDTSFSSWDSSDYIPVKPGMVLYFSSNELPIGVASTGAYFDADKKYLYGINNEPTVLTVPDGAYYLRFSKNGGLGDTLNTLKIEQYGITKFTPYGELYVTVTESALPSSIIPKWKGLKILTLGDSITAMGGVNGWTHWIKQYLLADKVVNVSVAGSTWQDKVANQTYDGNPQPSTDGNVMGNQVQKVLNAKSNGDADYQDFDVITFSFGTNDSVDFSVQTKESVENQFITNYAQNNFTVVPIDNVNRQTLAGSMRYGFQKLHEAYPNAVIFMCTPTQECYETFDSIYQKGDFINFVADRLGAETIDTRRCGIRNIYESQTTIDYDHPEQSGVAPIQTDLLDGIHTNENGAKKIAKYNAREIMKYFMIN